MRRHVHDRSTLSLPAWIAALVAALALVAAGCGKTSSVKEKPLKVPGGEPAARTAGAADRAGDGAGKRLAAAGVRRALCVNQQVGNQGLDERCRGLARAMRAVGGRSRVLSVDDMSPSTPKRIADAVRSGGIDGVLALNSTTGGQAVKAVDLAGAVARVKVATFDLGPDVLAAVRSGRLLFAVDQQAYLQGYLPVVLLTQRARYGLFPAQGDVIPTGPNFVTKADAGKAIELSKRSIR